MRLALCAWLLAWCCVCGCLLSADTCVSGLSGVAGAVVGAAWGELRDARFVLYVRPCVYVCDGGVYRQPLGLRVCKDLETLVWPRGCCVPPPSLSDGNLPRRYRPVCADCPGVFPVLQHNIITQSHPSFELLSHQTPQACCVHCGRTEQYTRTLPTLELHGATQRRSWAAHPKHTAV